MDEDTLIAMHVEVRRAERELAEVRLRRTLAIRAAHDAGWTKYRIAKALGLSQTAIAKELAD